MKRQSGAVTIFLVIILMASVLFAGVFIDASRILAAKHELRNATYSAARSAMSYYDKNLVGEYGLYAYDSTKVQANFEKYFNANIKSHDEGVNLLNYTVKSTAATPENPIGDVQIFQQQVAEYSKYRAPVTTTMMVVEKFKAIFNLGNKANQISKAGDKLDDFKKQFKNLGNQAVDLVSSAVVVFAAEKLNWNNIVESKNEFNSDMDDLLASYDQAIAKLEQVQREADTYKTTMDQEMNEISAGSGLEAVEESPEDMSDAESMKVDGVEQVDVYAKDEAQRVIEEVQRQKNRALALQSEINSLMTQYQQKLGELDSAKAEYESAQNTTKLKRQELIEIEVEGWSESYNRLEAEETRLSEQVTEKESELTPEDKAKASGYYALVTSSNAKQYRENGTGALKDFRTENSPISAELEEVMSLMEDLKMTSAEKYSIWGLLQEYTKQIQTAETELDQAEEAEEAAKNKVDSIQSAIDELKENISNKVNEIKTLTIPELNDIKEASVDGGKIDDALDGDSEDSEEGSNGLFKLKQIIDDFSDEFNATILKAERSTKDEVDTGGWLISKVKAVCSYFSEMCSVFTDGEKLLQNAYMVDYIMDKSTYVTSQTERDHKFHFGEAEYIVFGMEKQGDNIIAAVTSITTLRFAINFINYFITTPGEFVARAVGGLTRGAVQTAKDVYDLLFKDEGCSLCPSLKNVKVTYSDHLRLVLFMKFSGAAQGMLDVINTNQDYANTEAGGYTGGEKAASVSNLYTKLRANTKVGIDLIFVPMFGGEWLNFSNIENGQYIINTEAVLGY